MKVRFLPLLLAMSVAPLAHGDTMRCGNKLVHDGDTPGQVTAKCGRPAEAEHRSILRRPTVWIHGRPVFVGTGEVEIPVEVWTYNFGPNQFMRRLRFEDGLLVSVETLDYGYIE